MRLRPAAKANLLRILTPMPVIIPPPPERRTIALDVGAPIVDVTGPQAGSCSPDRESWWNDSPGPARPWWRSTIPECGYPNGNSSRSGYCVAITPFGRFVAEYISINGRLYLVPVRPTMSGWGDHAAYSASVEHDAPILWDGWRSRRVFDAHIERPTECPCWRCVSLRRE